MQCSEKHKTLTNGVGLCSRPMWMGGMPAGFCDEPAYGEQEPGQRRSGDWHGATFYPSYVGGLACYHHGGPKKPDDVKAQECVEAFKPLAEAVEKLKKTLPLKGLAIRFDGPPSHESGRFVEVEIDGKSVSIGEWVQDGDFWLLHLGESVKVVAR